jgi:hypothetical protein
MAWEPPQGLSIRYHYVYAGGGRGVAIVYAQDTWSLRTATAPFTGCFEFDVEPVMSLPEALAISEQIDNWADSVDPGSAQL